MFSQQIPATASETTQLALEVMALTASRRLLPSAMNDLREASSPPPMKAPLESAETAFLENASSMRSWEEFFGGDAYPPKRDYFSFFAYSCSGRCQDRKVCNRQSEENVKQYGIALNPSVKGLFGWFVKHHENFLSTSEQLHFSGTHFELVLISLRSPSWSFRSSSRQAHAAATLDFAY